ncbi:Uma2 family endonuclease [Limnofasciculus baicalensis]|uniref:Uma2 family endonuclease n=1 Tax=Limnofasciculus baicalensis BBK-W-15 TaxID=2699891 RepID=A0AAE3GSM3_9CYAN|nr:Uma2 family endonuclease [Limnofasciculus baicalensis]MCP2727822.1 Uma2 family endonuclease [Limnofasciculus baicalensis BBK-W-15]
MVTTILTPRQKQVHPEPLVTLRGISWQTYKSLMADVGDNRPWRIAYDGGVLEIRMPLQKHEEPKILIADFVTAIADELEIDMSQLGALTLERQDLTRAVEPDTCFYIQNESQIRGVQEIKLPENPPPDLVVESDYTSSSLNKFTLYASLGVPELWRYRKNTLEVYQLIEGEYQQVNNSVAFPFLPIAEIPGFIEQSNTIGQRAAVRLFRKRIAEILAQ